MSLVPCDHPIDTTDLRPSAPVVLDPDEAADLAALLEGITSWFTHGHFTPSDFGLHLSMRLGCDSDHGANLHTALLLGRFCHRLTRTTGDESR